MGASLSRQCGLGDDPKAGLAAAVLPLTAAVRMAQQQQQQQSADTAAYSNATASSESSALQRASALAARALAVLSLRRRGSGAAASPAAAAWLTAPQLGSNAQTGDAAPGAEQDVEVDPQPAPEAEPATAVILLRAELRLLQQAAPAPGASESSGGSEAPPTLSGSWLLEYGQPGGPGAATAAADARLLLGGTALPLVQQLLLPSQLPMAGAHGEAAAAALWRLLFHAALQSGAVLTACTVYDSR